MQQLRRINTLFLLCTLGCLASVDGQRDGQHDFDFNIGTWRTHITRLQHPLSGSTAWINLEGTVTVRKVWDGRAQLEEIQADGPNGHWEGLTLLLYNPQAHQWSQTFANSRLGTLSVPLIGEFKNGRGELFSQEPFNDRTILTRAVWSEIQPDSHHFEEAFSDDGGKTWETNFIATLAREDSGTIGGTINDAERAFLLEQMEQSKEGFLAGISGLSEAQWKFKPAPNVWSVEECAEHVILAEDFIFNTAQKTLDSPAIARPEKSTLQHDRLLAAGLLVRSSKAQAPPAITPTGTIATPAEAARLFTEKRDRHIAYVKTTQDDLRVHAGSLPGIGSIDGYQLILLMAAHSARHTEQIKEVQSNPNYPAR